MIGLFLEDFAPGQVVELGSYHFTRESVLAFAGAYDPQRFHIDDKAAAESHFGRLAASGWHTASAWMKCFVATNKAAREESLKAGRPVPEIGPSPGFRQLKWLKPVYPGDRVDYRSTAIGTRDLPGRQGWGLLISHNEGFNQDGALVFSFEAAVMTGKRPA
jgi:acyl dehydratase